MKNGENLILAGGCFWGVEYLMAKLPGVIGTQVGYTGGELENPTYDHVKIGTTGHAEAVKIEFDSEVITLKELLHYFFRIHDPTTLNQQGNDKGTQYRSTIFYKSEDDKKVAEEVIQEVNELGRFDNKVVTTLEAEAKFYPAEEFHQKYLVKYPNGYNCHYLRD